MTIPRQGFSISKVPGTYEGKLMLLKQMYLEAEESFDNEDKLYAFEMTEAEYRLFELVQTLGSDFASDISELLHLAHPALSLARSIEEAERILEDDRTV
jgi:hypothetical protein